MSRCTQRGRNPLRETLGREEAASPCLLTGLTQPNFLISSPELNGGSPEGWMQASRYAAGKNLRRSRVSEGDRGGFRGKFREIADQATRFAGISWRDNWCCRLLRSGEKLCEAIGPFGR